MLESEELLSSSLLMCYKVAFQSAIFSLERSIVLLPRPQGAQQRRLSSALAPPNNSEMDCSDGLNRAAWLGRPWGNAVYRKASAPETHSYVFLSFTLTAADGAALRSVRRVESQFMTLPVSYLFSEHLASPEFA